MDRPSAWDLFVRMFPGGRDDPALAEELGPGLGGELLAPGLELADVGLRARVEDGLFDRISDNHLF